MPRLNFDALGGRRVESRRYDDVGRAPNEIQNRPLQATHSSDDESLQYFGSVFGPAFLLDTPPVARQIFRSRTYFP